MEKEIYIHSSGAVIRLQNATPEMVNLLYERFAGYFLITENSANAERAKTLILIENSDLQVTSKPNVEIKKTETFYDHDNPEIWVVLGRPTSDDSILELHFANRNLAVYTMISRVIRSLILQLHFLQGKTFIHASAVSIKGKILAFTGPKYSGKTTCLLAMCKYTSALPVTNDKLSVYYQGSQAHAQGFPIKAGVRRGSIDLIDKDGFFNKSKICDPSSDKIIRVTMHELARKFNKVPVQSGPLCAICIPMFDSSLEGFSVRRYSSVEITNAWNENQLKSLEEIDPEQKALANFFPQQYEISTIPEIPFFYVGATQARSMKW
ncbi:hypothetical protein [Pseudomonas poae]|uniref:hypothetical protein n=1 Tax=Pseudomonas poae TaxID=200451 RepID=UPI0030CF5569